jgi:hypothetical protein
MADLKNFSIDFSGKSSSSRGIADAPEPEAESPSPVPSAQEMIDALYYYLEKRLNEIEAKVDECLKK